MSGRQVWPGSGSTLLRRALAEADTVVCEPVQRIALTCPEDTLAALLRVATRCGLAVETTEISAATAVTVGTISTEQLRELERAVPRLTRGEGSVQAEAAGWRPISSDRGGRHAG